MGNEKEINLQLTNGAKLEFMYSENPEERNWPGRFSGLIGEFYDQD